MDQRIEQETDEERGGDARRIDRVAANCDLHALDGLALRPGDALLFGLQRLGKYRTSATQGPVIVLVLDRDRIADYQTMVQQLRSAGMRAELYLGNPKNNVGQQLKYADRRGSPCAVIQGGDEKLKGEVQVKDLRLGSELASNIASREEYASQRLAQFSVAEADLVAAVKKALAQ